jgi:vacuolar-type H+-ATPase subunit H
MDRLRNAFASGTGFDLGEAFKGGADSADKMLQELKKKLQGAKDLQANAAKLAGMGYSQTFIEQVVKQGPEAGNKIAEALKNASPEATAEMQRLYGDVENISNNGLDTLAKSMNAGANLATKELRDAYNQVSTDLAESLKAVNEEMNKSLAETLVEYNKSVAEAEKTRQEAMAEAKKNLDEAMAEAKKRYDEAMAEALKNLTEAREKAQKALSEGLAEAQKTLQKALVDAQKDFEKAVDAINKSTQKKLDDLRSKIAEIAEAMKALSALAAALALAKIPTTQPIIPSTLQGSTVSGGGGGGNAAVMATSQTNININGYNLTDPAQTGTEIANQIKYGSFVRIAGSPGKVYAE